jgi:hypothetical protein
MVIGPQAWPHRVDSFYFGMSTLLGTLQGTMVVPTSHLQRIMEIMLQHFSDFFLTRSTRSTKSRSSSSSNIGCCTTHNTQDRDTSSTLIVFLFATPNSFIFRPPTLTITNGTIGLPDEDEADTEGGAHPYSRLR